MIPPMLRALAALTALTLAAPAVVDAAPKAKAGASAKASKTRKYHLDLAAVTARPEVAADVAKEATPRVEAQVKKTFATHPQLVATLEGAPDPDAAAPAYRKFLVKKGIAAAYLVTVEITEASTELVPMDSKPGAQRLVMRIGVHVLGENVPGRTMGFSGDGSSTVKVEVGKKVREADRTYAWDQAAEAAVADAMTTVFAQLAQPTKKLTK